MINENDFDDFVQEIESADCLKNFFDSLETKQVNCIDDEYLVPIFAKYLEFSINSINDLETVLTDFQINMQKIFNDIEIRKKYNNNSCLYDAEILRRLRAFCLHKEQYFSLEQALGMSCFAGLTNRLIKRNNKSSKGVKILEIASGVVPYTSIALDKRYNVECMDTRNVIPEKALNKIGVSCKPSRQAFGALISVEEFDYVIGRKPCGLVSIAVEKCVQNGINFIFQLCDDNCESFGYYVKKNKFVSEIKKFDRKNIQFYKVNNPNYDCWVYPYGYDNGTKNMARFITNIPEVTQGDIEEYMHNTEEQIKPQNDMAGMIEHSMD